MKLTRRRTIQGAAALGAGVLLPRFSVAEIPAGPGTVTTVSDGHLVIPGGYGDALPEDELAAILDAFGADAEVREPPCNLTLYRDGTNAVLFDAGSGSSFMPTAGKLLDSLDAIGVAPDEITHLVITHGHPDHVWGLLDDFDEPAFPEASHLIGGTEWDYWMDTALVDAVAPELQSFVVGAQRRLGALADRMERFDDGDTVAPGVSAVLTPGHTPGHMSFHVGGNRGVFVLGDAVTNPHFNFLRPAWPSPNDTDPDLAAATRVALLDRLASAGEAVVGFHLPGGGIGHVRREGEAFRFDAAEG